MATRQSLGTRAKDSDRNDTCQVLDHALSEGQLSMEEHRQRVSAATNAMTLGELQSLVSDLQMSSAPVQLPKLKTSKTLPTGGWGMRIAVAAVLVLLGMGIGWGVYGNTSSPLSFTSDPGAKPDGIAPVVLTPPKQLQSLNGLTGLIEQARKKFGDTMGYRLVIYPDYAVMDRADPTTTGASSVTPTAEGGAARPTTVPRAATTYWTCCIVPYSVPNSARNVRTIRTAAAFSSGLYLRVVGSFPRSGLHISQGDSGPECQQSLAGG